MISRQYFGQYFVKRFPDTWRDTNVRQEYSSRLPRSARGQSNATRDPAVLVHSRAKKFSRSTPAQSAVCALFAHTTRGVGTSPKRRRTPPTSACLLRSSAPSPVSRRQALGPAPREQIRLRYTDPMTKISILDTNWMGRPHSIAAALLESRGQRAVVDPGPESTLPALREQLQANGLSVADLDAILVTHIHLDHAGATGSLVRENPRLSVYVHSKGAPHLADPSKLLASASRLWGDGLTPLFGNTLPVPPENLHILE